MSRAGYRHYRQLWRALRRACEADDPRWRWLLPHTQRSPSLSSGGLHVLQAITVPTSEPKQLAVSEQGFSGIK